MGLSAAFRFADGPAGAIVTLIFCHESREKCRIPQANDDVQRDREEYGKAEGHDDTRCAEWDAEIITRDHVHPIPIQRPAMIAAVWSLELLETHLALTNKFSILKKGSGDLIITGDQATLHPLHQYHQTRQYSWQRGANQVPTELIWPFRGTRSDRHCLDIITMYELFLTALVEDADFQAACAVLGGFCAMPPWETVNRVLYFQGPPRPAGISNQSSIDKPMRKDVAFLYKDLHQNLSRQSFVLQARYEILKDRDMGPSSAPQDLDAAAGILRWADFPDPPTARPVLTQRKVVELWEQKKLPSVMRDNNYQCVEPRVCRASTY